MKILLNYEVITILLVTLQGILSILRQLDFVINLDFNGEQILVNDEIFVESIDEGRRVLVAGVDFLLGILLVKGTEKIEENILRRLEDKDAFLLVIV